MPHSNSIPSIRCYLPDIATCASSVTAWCFGARAVNGQAAEYSEHELLLEPRENGNDIETLRLTETIGQDKRRVQWLAGVPARNTFGPAKVPSENFLMLGDNRDNSADSRYFGFVPRHLLIGQAQRILVSADIKGSWLPRPERFRMQLQ